jgi:DNA repair protein RecN (Recombination protein N)
LNFDGAPPESQSSLPREDWFSYNEPRMLVELLVENYAVVERARVRFREGLNLLTGETGSGKSIVVDALGLLFGSRASAEVVRSDAERARVSGVFSVDRGSELAAALDEAGIEFEDGDLIIEREVGTNGKSRAFVNNRPVTTQLLRQIAPHLGDIHGQNQQQALFTETTQRDLLDAAAQLGTLKHRVGALYRDWKEVRERLEEFSQNEQEKLRLLDLWSFQKKEIESTSPRPGEDAALESERRVLQNSTRLEEAATSAFTLLYDSPESVTARLNAAIKRVDELERIDPKLSETQALLKQASISVDEASTNVRDYLAHIENDPSRLEDVETRLAALDKLKRKYGGSLDEVLSFLKDVKQRIDEVENASEHRQRLEAELKGLEAEYENGAEELSARRKDAAARLAKQVEHELKSLAMAGTQFRISVTDGDWTSTGKDQIHFQVSPNRGEELRPLEKVASGGELSRLSLALKTSMGATDGSGAIHTLVFDEVDAGVGGAAAASVGKRLKQLSRTSQVICVTHLAQIAGFADHHYAVAKREKKGRVGTEIEELGPAERAQEIGRMLSGETITAEALRQAEQLIQAGAVE